MRALRHRHHTRPLLRRALSRSNASAAAPVPSQVVSLARLAHRGRLQLRLSDRAHTSVEVVPVLAAAECELRAFGTNTFAVAFDDVTDGDDADADALVATVRVTRDAAVDEQEEPTRLQLFLPALVNLDVALAVGDVEIRDKLEGDVKVVVGDGNIRVHKLRGDAVSLKTSRGALAVAALVEGERVALAASSIACKRLMAASAEIKIGKSGPGASGVRDSEFGAIYSPACVIVHALPGGAVQVGNVHGYLRVAGDEMRRVSVHSVNGALDVEDSGRSCAAVVHFDALALDAKSSVLVGGDVRVSVEPGAALEVELHGREVATGGCGFADGALLDQLDVDYAIFTGELQAAASAAAAASSSSSSGKINASSAKSAALRTSFFMGDEREGPGGGGSGGGRQPLAHPAQLPQLLVHATSGRVTLEQLDWMAKLKRQHLTPQE
ncbi:hypothetical protein PybrP1_011559 [[Pythium] brassicae (nom. inval.)]|nr:hypothetical protein PybrP1_011559 [[Pythium] brassicae (nom. inval.)]